MNKKHQVCPVCGDLSKFISHQKLPAIIFHSKVVVGICNNCGAGVTTPPPITDVAHYQNNQAYVDAFSANANQYNEFAEHILNFLSRAALNFNMDLTNARLLDVGAGRGFLVERANLNGYSAIGIELNNQNVGIAQGKGIPLFTSIQDASGGSSKLKFDVLVFSAIVEHVNNPAEFVKNYLQYLKPGGILLLSQAAYDGFLPTLAPWLWYGWQPHEHFIHFNLKSLKVFMRRCGGKKVYFERNSLYHPIKFSSSAKRLLGKNFASVLGKIGASVGCGDQIYMAAII